MFGSMCVIMVFNVIFLKLLLSAMSYMPVGLDTFPWMLVIVGIARTARKIDGIITRIGLNPAITGDGLGRGLPGMLAYSVIKSMGSVVGKTIGAQGGHRPTAGAGAKSGSPKGPPGGFGGARSSGPGRGQPSPGGTSTANHFADGGAAGAAQPGRGAPQAGTATAASAGATGQPGTHGAAGSTYAASSHQERQDATFTGTAETARPSKAETPSRPPSGGIRRTSVTHPSGHGRTAAPGMAGTAASRAVLSPDGAKTPGRAGMCNTARIIAQRLSEEADSARRYLDLCGLEVLEPRYSDNALLELLYELVNKQTSRRVKLPPGVFDMTTMVHRVYE